MQLFRRKKPKQNTEERSYIPYMGGGLLYNSLSSYSDSQAMLLSAVYRCVEVISDSIAQLPIDIYKIDNEGYKLKYTNHPAYYLLSKEPNSIMSRYTLFKTLIVSMLLKGNGYAYIKRDVNGNAVELIYIPSDYVTVIEKNNKIYYNVVGQAKPIESTDIIHILNFSYDGVRGVSTLTHARNTLELSTDSEAHAKNFFQGGGNISGILKVESSLTSQQKQDIRTSWNNTFNSNTGGQSNGIAILEGNMNYQPISVNPTDAQLLQTREFNVVDVCRFFGVSPVKAFDLSKSSYSTIEATNLAFLSETINPLLTKIELEIERKLFLPSEKKNIDIKFDTSVLLRSDKAATASYYNTMLQSGIMSINEVRRELDLNAIDNGNYNLVQVNMSTLDRVVEGQNNNDNQLILNNLL